MALGFYQVLLSLGNTFDLDPLPTDYLLVMSYFSFLDFDWSGLAYPVGCLTSGYHGRLLVVSLAPIVIIAGILLVAWGTRRKWCSGMNTHRFMQFDDTATRNVHQSHAIELPETSLSAGRVEQFPPGSTSAREEVEQGAQPHHSFGVEAGVVGEMPQTRSSKKEPATALYLVLMVIFTFLPNVSRAIFSVWVCVWYVRVCVFADMCNCVYSIACV